MKARGLTIAETVLITLVPIVLALVVNGILIAALGRNPITFYSDTLQSGLLQWPGLQNSIVRSAPLLFIAAGLIVAFQAHLWNLGANGQFLLGAAFTAGFAPPLLESSGVWPMLALTLLVAAFAGAVWTIVPALLRGLYGVNEIVTSLMMSFIGLGVAQLLVKGPFKTDSGGGVARTKSIPFDERLPTLFGTKIHLGFVLAVVAILVVHLMMTRTSLGLKLRVLGANPRAALHAGLNPVRLTVIAFAISGMFVGLAGWVDILGYQGSFRAEYNPGYGLLVVPLVFLGRLNALGSMILVIGFSILLVGGEAAARKAGLTTDMLLVLVGLILLFMALTEYFRVRRGQATKFVPEEIIDRVRPRPSDEDRPSADPPGIGTSGAVPR